MASTEHIALSKISPLSKMGNRALKRSFDILFSLVVLLSLFPLFYLVFGVLIKLSSSGGVLFRQRRSGLNGESFWIYKFRSMRLNDLCDTAQASEDDPRKTRIGDFMRRHNIDELPQFINVLRGDMSVVGPRPHMVSHTEEYSSQLSGYLSRHCVRPGITGWAQISGYRGEIQRPSQLEGRVRRDVWYIENWRFGLDLYIIFRTIGLTLSCRDRRAF